MKILIKRHERPFCIFRAAAIAQALAEAGHSVAIECFQQHAAVLVPTGVAWKHPHSPHAVGERRTASHPGENPGKLVRPAMKFWDEVLDLDGDGMFEHRWAAFGRTWWEWAKAQAKALEPKCPFIPDWPALAFEPDTAQMQALPPSFVLVSVLSDEAMPTGLNVNALEAHIGVKFPGSRILWSAFGDYNFGPGREVLVANSYADLADQCACAQAVFAVNGIAGALARSFRPGRAGPLAKRFCYIQVAPEHPRLGRPDPFGVIRGLLASPPNKAQGGIVTFNEKLELTLTQPVPD